MKIDDLYELKKKDIDKSAEILAKAFYDYPLFKYILGNNHNKENVEIYEKYGFRVVSEDVIPGTDIIQFNMLKE